MTNQRDAAEAVELAHRVLNDLEVNLHCWGREQAIRVAAKRVIAPALASLPAASEGEPVAWMYARFRRIAAISAERDPLLALHHQETPLYAHPAPSDQEKLIAELVEALERVGKHVSLGLKVEALITRARQNGERS